MSMIECSRIEYVNSAMRENGTNENFTYTLNLSPNESYDNVCVLYANIPISYYLVVAGLNTFQVTENGTTVTVTVPPGNYSAPSFINVVVPLINTASPNGWVYAIALNNSFTNVSNGLFYYTVTGNSSQPSFTFTNSFLYEQFGFNANSTNTFVSNTLTSVNVLNFIPETSIFLYSNLIETKQNNTSNILQEFYGENNVNFSNLVYQCTSLEGYSKRINGTTTNSFTLTLLDEHNNILDLNGQPFFLTLLFYKKSDIFDVVKKFIKFTVMKTQ
jgi:hypothetical protein